MSKGLIGVVLFGAFIGLLMPGGRSHSGAPEATSTTYSAVPVETRVHRSEGGHFYVHALVNGQLVRFVVDTGATTVALTPEDAERVGIKLNPSSFEVIGEGAAGPIRGQMVQLDSVNLDGKQVNHIRAA
ncbi:MAG: TIGR02281 family clan AA aspartic protease, partial [Sphingomonadaceae bacterium]|nr:TIGR02281 family clan AA aspartic protease [Sphingomonadaceae bacterium]